MAHPTWTSSILLCGALAFVLPACGSQDDLDPLHPDDGPMAAHQERAGAPGAHAWLPTSVALKISSRWSYSGWGGRPSSSGETSAAWNKGDLSEAQKTWLETLVLLPLDNRCTADGYSYKELVVSDADGTSKTYRTTGCQHLRVEGATAMLPEVEPLPSFWK
jgi:hypothetical protein